MSARVEMHDESSVTVEFDDGRSSTNIVYSPEVTRITIGRARLEFTRTTYAVLIDGIRRHSGMIDIDWGDMTDRERAAAHEGATVVEDREGDPVTILPLDTV